MVLDLECVNIIWFIFSCFGLELKDLNNVDAKLGNIFNLGFLVK